MIFKIHSGLNNPHSSESKVVCHRRYSLVKKSENIKRLQRQPVKFGKLYLLPFCTCMFRQAEIWNLKVSRHGLSSESHKVQSHKLLRISFVVFWCAFSNETALKLIYLVYPTNLSYPRESSFWKWHVFSLLH